MAVTVTSASSSKNSNSSYEFGSLSAGLLPQAAGKDDGAPGAAVEIEPRFYGLRAINEREGSFEADVGLKVRFRKHSGTASIHL